jgi:hypothetical protein
MTTKNAARLDSLERLIHGLEKDATRTLMRLERLEGILFRLVGALAHWDPDVRELMRRRPDLVADQMELWETWTAKLVGDQNSASGRPAMPPGSTIDGGATTEIPPSGASQIPPETTSAKPV